MPHPTVGRLACLAVILPLALLLAGCGGGPGGSSAPAPPDPLRQRAESLVRAVVEAKSSRVPQSAFSSIIRDAARGSEKNPVESFSASDCDAMVAVVTANAELTDADKAFIEEELRKHVDGAAP